MLTHRGIGTVRRSVRGRSGAQHRGTPPLVGIGLAGAGSAALAHHLPALAGLPGAQVVALADPDAAALACAGALAPGAALHADPAALLADPRVEVVGVLTPPSEHVRIAGDALAAGRHVLVEKPLGLAPGAAAELQAAADRAGLVLGAGFVYRRHRLVARARELVAAGALGRLRTISATMTGAAPAAGWRRDRGRGGGVLLDLGPHQVDLWRHLTGRELEALHVTEAPDGASAALAARLAGDVSAAAVLGAGAGANHTLQLAGSAATLTLRLDRHDGLELVPAGSLPGDPAQRVRRGIRLAGEVPGLVRARRGGGDLLEAFAAQWADLLTAVRGGAPFAPGAADARAALAPLLAARAEEVAA